MYEFRAKTPTQYDFMSGVSPCRFEAESSRKMDSSSRQKGHAVFQDPYLLFLAPFFFFFFFPPIERGDLGRAAPLMRSCFAWLVITERFSPLLGEDMFCFSTQMGFSHWHEPVFDCAGEGVRAGHSEGSAPLTSHLSICDVDVQLPL